MNSSLSSVPSGVPNSLKEALGCDLLGAFLGLILYGIIINQFYKYCRTFPSDATFIRVSIIFVMALETVQVAITMHYTYFFLVTKYADPGAFANGTWSVNIDPLVLGLIMVVSQLFFIGRIYMIGPRSRIIAIVAAFLALGQIVLATYVVHELFAGTLEDDLKRMKWCIGFSLLIPALVDALLTSTLVVVLRRSRASLKRSDSIIDLVMIYGINTGFLHWMLNSAAFISFISVANPFISEIYGPFDVAAVRVYAITFLSVLNSRETKSAVAIFDSGAYGLKAIERMNRRVVAETWNLPQVPDEDPASINIRVTTELEDGKSWGAAKMTSSKTSSGSELECTF